MHRPLHQYLDMRQQCRAFKSAAACPCGWLFLWVLSYEGMRRTLNPKPKQPACLKATPLKPLDFWT